MKSGGVIGSFLVAPVSAIQSDSVPRPAGPRRVMWSQIAFRCISGCIRRQVDIGDPITTERRPTLWAPAASPYGPAPTIATSTRSTALLYRIGAAGISGKSPTLFS